MEELHVLVTAAGASVIESTIYSLKKNPDGRKIRVIGVDTEKNVAGRYLSDLFFVVPDVNSREYLSEILNICRKEGVKVILPCSSEDVVFFAENREKFEAEGIAVAVSGLDSVDSSNNKFKFLSLCRDIGIPHPEFYLVDNFSDLSEKAGLLGFPERNVVVKPLDSSGGRGVRIITKNSDRQKKFYTEKPDSMKISIEELHFVLGDSFPPLLILEFLPGKEYTVDCFRNEKVSVEIPRTRDFVKLGVSFESTLDRNEEIISLSRKISDKLNLKFCFGFQFRMDKNGNPKILECNPRIQGTTVASTFGGANLIYASVKSALSEPLEEFKVNWGTKVLRYFGNVGINSSGERVY